MTDNRSLSIRIPCGRQKASETASATHFHFSSPSWKINEQKVVEILNFFKIANADIEPGGHDWPAIERSIHSNQRAFAGIGPKMMCVKANAMYGPKGAVSPGLMEPK